MLLVTVVTVGVTVVSFQVTVQVTLVTEVTFPVMCDNGDV